MKSSECVKVNEKMAKKISSTVSQKTMMEILDVISRENEIPMKTLMSQIAALWERSYQWGSSAAKELAVERGVNFDKIVPTGKDGKILRDDVLRAVGDKIPDKKKGIYPFVSKPAYDLAAKHDLVDNVDDHFPMKTRTGKDRNQEQTRISVEDVRKKIGLSKDGEKERIWASEQAEELALKYGIDPEEIDGSGKNGKIKLGDVQALVKKMTPKKLKAKDLLMILQKEESDDDSSSAPKSEENDDEYE